MSHYDLPQSTLPENALILFEFFGVEEQDLAGNWRFLITNDGQFLHSRNSPSSTSQDDSAWNEPLEPVRQFTQAQLSTLMQALKSAKIAKLSGYYATQDDDLVSNSTVERWTIVDNNSTHTIVVENDEAPRDLKRLRQTIDKLVADAPFI